MRETSWFRRPIFGVGGYLGKTPPQDLVDTYEERDVVTVTDDRRGIAYQLLVEIEGGAPRIISLAVTRLRPGEFVDAAELRRIPVAKLAQAALTASPVNASLPRSPVRMISGQAWRQSPKSPGVPTGTASRNGKP